jgi:hypothetical protein
VHQWPNVIGVSVRFLLLHVTLHLSHASFLQIRLGFSYSDRPQHHSGLFSGIFKKFDKTTGVIQTKARDCSKHRVFI